MSAPRLNKERQELQKVGHQVILNSDTVWNIFIKGPQDSPFAGGQFQLQFKLDNFPFKGPVVSFKTKIYHPNVNEKGQICEDMLETGKDWAPTKKLVAVMDKIVSLMVAPNLDSPLNQEAAKDYSNGSWQAKAKQITQQYAK